MTTSEHDYIAEDLRPLAFPIASLRLLDGNPRRGDVDAVARSYARFGQRKPLVARRSDMQVIAGNHQLQAAQRLGWTHLAVVWTDDDDLTAKAFALADNRTSELGFNDDELLGDLIQQVSVNPDLLFAASYSLGDIDALLAETEPDPAAAPEEFSVIEPDDLETQYRWPACGYEWSGAARPGQPTHQPHD